MTISTHGDGQAQNVSLRQILSEPSIRVVLLIVFVIMLGFGIIVPILPLYARSFGVSYDVASLLISAFAFARLIFDPVAGPIVGRYGERLSAMTGVTAVGISALLTGFAPNFALAVLFRAAGGFGSSLLFAALYSFVLKVVPSQRMGRTMSAFYGTLNVGLIAGGPIGGVVAHAWGLASPLFVYSGLCFLSGVLYLRFMPDPNVGRETKAEARPSDMGGWRTVWAQSRELLRVPAFVTVLVLNMAFFWMAAGGYDTLVPLFGKEGLGMSPVGIGGVFAIAVAAEFVVLYPAGSASDRIGRRRVLIPA